MSSRPSSVCSQCSKSPKQDELIAGTDRGGELPPEVDPDGDGTIDAEVEDRSGDAAPLSRESEAEADEPAMDSAPA
jgi:hypothetical protein